MTNIERDSLLKICISDTEAIYFKVVSTEITAFGIQEICSVHDGQLVRSAGNRLNSFIYSSEVGVRYHPVDEEEKAWLRTKYRKATKS